MDVGGQPTVEVRWTDVKKSMAGEGEALRTAEWSVIGERFRWSSSEYEQPIIGIGSLSPRYIRAPSNPFM
ncbi:unnamed protein product [Ilex paraguariensis]|uniref:Uncharacterized protein n=1 Tax=Ilex paraguariensis TaxID=185542 RepID=A0ABC8RG16_9AQUA